MFSRPAAPGRGQAEPGKVPPELMEALKTNEKLKEALAASGMPLRFQAMVLGLSTLKQLGEEREPL